jgi:hypothetical protein
MTKQSRSWEANSSSASQKIPRFLRNPIAHYRIHKNPPPVPTLSQTPSPNPLSWGQILILHTHLRLGLPSVCLRFPHRNHARISSLPPTCYIPRPSYWSARLNSIWWGVETTLHGSQYYSNQKIYSTIRVWMYKRLADVSEHRSGHVSKMCSGFSVALLSIAFICVVNSTVLSDTQFTDEYLK